jgi:hypothetical protein
MPTKSEQLLAKTLREAYPDLKVIFGTFGSKDGLSVASMTYHLRSISAGFAIVV